MKNRKTGISIKYKDNPAEYKHQWYILNKAALNERNKLYRDTHKEQKSRMDRLWRLKNKEYKRLKDKLYFATYRNTTKYRMSVYKTGARLRGYSFMLSENEFEKIIHAPCYYCGSDGFGIDRIDNTLGYVLGNIVPSCKMCNKMKHVYDQKIFIEQCIKIAQYNEHN